MKKLLIITILSILTFGCGGNSAPNNQVANATKATNTTNTATAPKKDSSNLPAMPNEIMQAEMKSPDGKTFKLADTKDKVLLVNLWAIWCGPCKKEMPDIEKLNSEMKDKIQAISVTAFDEDNPEAQVKSFLKEKNFTYSQGITDAKIWDALVKTSKEEAIPINFVLTKDGKIVKTLVGGKSYEEFKSAVEEALAY
jgi:thiol-disulfide isomerase/thioredoxin